CLPFWPGCGSSSEPTPCESGTCEAAGSTDGSGGRNTGEGAANDGVRDSDLLCPASSCDGWACPPVFGAPVAVPAVSVAAAWVVFDSAWVVFDSACVVFDTAVSATCCSAVAVADSPASSVVAWRRPPVTPKSSATRSAVARGTLDWGLRAVSPSSPS